MSLIEPGLVPRSRHVVRKSSADEECAFTRWDEKAGLQRDAIRSQCLTCSRHKKETGDEED